MNLTVTPSQLARVANCLRSETLEHTFETSEAAHNGTVAHRYLCNTLLLGQEAALSMEADSDQLWLANIDVERLPAFEPDKYAPEVALAWNPRAGTARVLGFNLTREQAREKKQLGEMVGLADVVGVTDDAVVIMDYKTGFGFIDAASINWQILTYALMAMIAYGKKSAVVSIVRARADGFVWHDTYHADFFRMQEHEAEVIRILDEREKVLEAHERGEKPPPYVEGPWCTYCPARMRCESKTLQLVALSMPAPSPDGLTQSSEFHRMMPLLDEAQLPLVWEKVKFMEKAIKRVKDEVKALARQKPIPLGGGYVLGKKPDKDTKILPEKALEVLVATFGANLGDVVFTSAAKKSLSQEALKKSLQKHVLPTLPKPEAKITKLFRSTMDLLDKAGAVQVTVDENAVCEHRVGDESEPPLLVDEKAA